LNIMASHSKQQLQEAVNHITNIGKKYGII
jgi:hypothetical protein